MKLKTNDKKTEQVVEKTARAFRDDINRLRV